MTRSISWFAAFALLCAPLSLHGQEKALKRADLFGPDKLWSIHLKLGAKEYQTMQPKSGGKGFGNPFGKKENPPPKDEKKDPADQLDIHKNKGFGIEFPFVKGDIEFAGKSVKTVGIRYKGNSTYGSSAQGLKRPFKIDINRYVENQKLYGLNGFALGNGVMDPTRIREALAFSLFRSAKVPAPRTAFVKLSLSVADKYDKTYVGVYTLIEPVDKSFLREHFKSDKGMLLKPERIQGLPYLGDTWAAYQDKYNPKREPTKAQTRRLIEFTKLVNQADDVTFNQKIAGYLDVDGFLRFAAVNSLISNLDSFFGLGHNYYLYLSPKSKQFHFIPWDLDLAFGGFPFAGGVDQTDWSIAQPYMGKNKLTQRVLAMKKYNDAYREHLKALTEKTFNSKEMNAAIGVLEATIKDALAAEPAPKFGKGMGMGFPGNKSMPLRDFVAKRNESVLAQFDGKSKGKPIVMNFGPGKGPGFGGFGIGNMLAKPILATADVNKDGKLSLNEFKTVALRLFNEAGGDEKTPVGEKELSEAINRIMAPPKGAGGLQPPKGFRPGRPLSGAILKQGRAGDDMKLTREQFMTGAEKLFKQWDKGNIGQLDEKRLADGINSAMPPPGFGPGPGRPGFGIGNALAKPIFQAADANQDGKLSLDEFTKASARLFKAAGGDDKTPVGEKELLEAIDGLMPAPAPPKGFGPGRPLAGAILKQGGAGADRKLTRDQFMAGANKLFKQWDKDKLGHLDEKRLADGINNVMASPAFGPGPGFGPPPKGKMD